MLIPNAPAEYSQSDQAQLRGVLDREDKRNVKQGAPFASPVVLPSYVKTALPSAAEAAGMIYVTNDTGGAVPAFSDGTNWRRVTDRNVIS